MLGREAWVVVCLIHKELAPGIGNLRSFEVRAQGMGLRVRGSGASLRILRGIGARGA